jgi:hypothetical protein
VVGLPRDTTNGRPPGKGSRPKFAPASAADQSLAKGSASAVIVSHRTDKRRKAQRAPAVYASVYAPCEGRHLWWLAYICPFCKLGHLGRARTEAEVEGPRRSRCGRMVVVRVARVYRGRTEAAA